MSDGFYRAFEERYRGSRELIKDRLSAYLPFVEPLLKPYLAAAALDIGCGRGEWLELLAGSGFEPIGVDFDSTMLESCHELGLSVEQGDAIAFLSELPNESQVIVSAFHLVEHITFEQLQTLIAEALRVLKPGGLLIMETPNPENIVVATCSFYLDPSHQRPIPPMLLAFVAEYAGFVRVKTLRFQESKQLVKKEDPSLQDVFAGASPDYAVIAQKGGAKEILDLINGPFSCDYGLSLDNLLNRWDVRFDRLEAKAEQAEAKAEQAEAKAEQAEAKAEQAEAKAEQAEVALCAINNSSSWRLTAPLRMVGCKAQRINCFAKTANSESKEKVRLLLKHAKLYINQRPKLRHLVLSTLGRFPALECRIRQVARAVFSSQSIHANFEIELVDLTQRARSIYFNLKEIIESRNKEIK